MYQNYYKIQNKGIWLKGKKQSLSYLISNYPKLATVVGHRARSRMTAAIYGVTDSLKSSENSIEKKTSGRVTFSWVQELLKSGSLTVWPFHFIYNWSDARQRVVLVKNAKLVSIAESFRLQGDEVDSNLLVLGGCRLMQIPCGYSSKMAHPLWILLLGLFDV